ncbi:MAG: aldehyde dehydrogenase family protein, partial [Chitinophagales bacterium]
KSPVVLDDTANINSAVKRLTWGKYLNCGQTCISPDYMMVHSKKYDETLEKLKKNIEKVYGATKEEQQKNESYARIVNEKHFHRLKGLIEDAVEKGANIYYGGNMDESENYIQPTILTDVPDNAKIMHEEIFGPLFPIQKIDDIKDSIEIIRSKEKPLAMYIFSTKDSNVRYLLNNTSSGGVTVNDTVLHHSQPNLPFGGVNHSGIGSGHGIFGFKAFSHERAVMKQASGFSAAEGMYPPYGGIKDKLIDLTIKYL